MSGGWWCAHAEHGARGQREESGRGLVHSRIGADLLVVRVEARARASCRSAWARRNRSGRADCWVKVKNPVAPAVTREAEEEWN